MNEGTGSRALRRFRCSMIERKVERDFSCELFCDKVSDHRISTFFCRKLALETLRKFQDWFVDLEDFHHRFREFKNQFEHESRSTRYPIIANQADLAQNSFSFSFDYIWNHMELTWKNSKTIGMESQT